MTMLHQAMKNLFGTLYRNPYFKALWDSRFPHFIFIGIINTGFSYIIFAILIYLRLNYMLAVFISTSILSGPLTRTFNKLLSISGVITRPEI